VTIAKRLFGERGTARVKARFPISGKTNILAREAGHCASFSKGRSVLPVVSQRQHIALAASGLRTQPDNGDAILSVSIPGQEPEFSEAAGGVNPLLRSSIGFDDPRERDTGKQANEQGRR
jgi:hypothetical protein